VKWCLQNGVPVLPGVSTPTEIERAMSLGLTYLKFFPAEASGGKEMLSALYAPYRDIRFMPTGGICLENMKAYLSLPNVFACGGSWICRPELIDAENFGEIERLSSEAVAAMHGFELLHVESTVKMKKRQKEPPLRLKIFSCRKKGMRRIRFLSEGSPKF
jgi:2-dehydro-3-deoxyphosphogluconate aldolase/(4S)-4-hydroxy-2-oxoglutarate aldolase